MTHLINDGVNKLDRLYKAVGKAHTTFLLQHGRYPTLAELAKAAKWSEYLTSDAVKELRIELLEMEVENV